MQGCKQHFKNVGARRRLAKPRPTTWKIRTKIKNLKTTLLSRISTARGSQLPKTTCTGRGAPIRSKSTKISTSRRMESQKIPTNIFQNRRRRSASTVRCGTNTLTTASTLIIDANAPTLTGGRRQSPHDLAPSRCHRCNSRLP
jgi:hypothetical protein